MIDIDTNWPRKIAGLVLLVPCLLVIPVQAVEAPRDPYAHFFHSTFGDFDEELETGREQGKLGILIFFEMDDCPFCHRMKEMVLNQPRIQDWYRERFLCFTVDIEGDTEVRDFQGNTMTAKEFSFRVNKVRATPVFAFYDLAGKPVVRFTGATRDAEEFLWLGEFVADRHYETGNFTRYKRARRAARKTSQQTR